MRPRLAAFRYCILIGLLASVVPFLASSNTVSAHELELVLLATPSRSNGAKLFDTCAACHGPAGQGSADGLIPAIAGQHFKVLARQLVDFRSNKRWDEGMLHFANSHHLQDAQAIADVASFVNTLAVAKNGTGQSSINAESVELYGRLCASCHGLGAEGSGARAIPRLAGQHYEYLLHQMHDFIEGRRADYSTDHLMFNQLQQAQLEPLARYLSLIPPADD